MLVDVENLAPGFLIAMPQLGDPNFHRSVVLMIEQTEGGAMGLVINRISPVTLKDLADGQSLEVSPALSHEAIFMGGPVEPQRGFVLHTDAGIEEKKEIVAGLFLSVTVDSLAPILKKTEGPLRFCLGYAGWGPQQLEQEIAQGSWLFTEATSRGVLHTPPESLWEETLRGMGVDPAMLQVGRGVQ